jgi:two-component system sensor histidine kinase UhpB
LSGQIWHIACFGKRLKFDGWCTVDLRRRLVAYLGALLLGLILVVGAVTVWSIRDDAAQEVAASERLAVAMLAAGQLGHGRQSAEALARLEATLAQGPLRHITISYAKAGTAAARPPSGLAGWLAAALGVEAPAAASYRIRFGDDELVISPNPASEIEEILRDAVRFCITLLLFSGATLLVAWSAAHRALSPVRQLEAGLQRLARGEADPALPAFALKEFARVAKAIDQLAAALEAARAGQRHLARRLISVQEAERRQLARELHDDMGQMLTAAGVTAAYLERHGGAVPPERVAECGRELQRDVGAVRQQLRAMLKRLRPHGLDGLSLADALRELVDGWRQRESGIDFELALPAEFPPVRPEVCLVLYRVVQEALTNVVRHSGATHCRVELCGANGELHLSVRDDGRGRAAEIARRQGSGLLGMRERLAMVGGSLEVADRRPQGLQLLARIAPAAKEGEENDDTNTAGR